MPFVFFIYICTYLVRSIFSIKCTWHHSRKDRRDVKGKVSSVFFLENVKREAQKGHGSAKTRVAVPKLSCPLWVLYYRRQGGTTSSENTEPPI